MKVLKSDFGGIKTRWVMIALVISLVAIVLGSKFDLAIAGALYSENSTISNIFNIIGKLPSYAAFGFSGVLYFIAEKNAESKKRKIISYIVAFITSLTIGGLYGYDDFGELISNKILAIIVGIIIVCASDFGLFMLLKNSNREKAFKLSLCILMLAIVLIPSMIGLKYAGMRPRYKTIVGMDFDYFRNWWDFDISLKENFDAKDLHSWPSAHGAFAAASILYVPMLSLNDKLEKHQTVINIIAILFAIVVGFTRLLDGSHYLSDVGWGLLISYILIFLIFACFYNNKNSMKIIKNDAGAEKQQ